MKRCSGQGPPHAASGQGKWTGARPSLVGFTAALLVGAPLVGGCSGQTSTPSPSPSIAVPAVTAAATANPMGPMTGAELLWLEAIGALHKEIDSVLPREMDSRPETLRSLAKQLRGCTGELVRLGSPSLRLQPVYVLAKQGCVEYDKAAACFETAASIGIPVAGTASERKSKEALDCGFAASGEGSRYLAEAEVKGFEIKEAAR